jgi:hypothetical protein
MGFAERADKALEKAMVEGRVCERLVRDVLKSKAEGKFAAGWLDADEPMVRRLAARLVAAKGPIEALVTAAAAERDRGLLMDMLGMLSRLGAPVEPLEWMLRSEDVMVRDAAVEMFRKAGKAEFLFPMVFSEDEPCATRAKRYMDEKGKT